MKISRARTCWPTAAVLSLVLVSVGFCGPAFAQVDRQLPDFYTRPTVSPYVDLLRRNDGRDSLRYQRNVLPELQMRDAQRRNLQEQRNLQNQIQQGFQRQDQMTDRLLEDLRGEAEQLGPQAELRYYSPFYQPASNPLTGASLRIRPTGHATTVQNTLGRFGRGSGSASGRGFSGGSTGLLNQPQNRAPTSRSLNRARSLSNRYR